MCCIGKLAEGFHPVIICAPANETSAQRDSFEARL